MRMRCESHERDAEALGLSLDDLLVVAPWALEHRDCMCIPLDTGKISNSASNAHCDDMWDAEVVFCKELCGVEHVG